MTKAYTKFKANIASASILERIFEYLSKKTLPFEPDELLRAEYVMLVGAFDCYVHDFVRERMVKAFNNPSTMTNKTRDYKVSLGVMMEIINETNPISRMQLLESEIKKTESANSYQSSTSVENALGMIGFKNIWNTLWGKDAATKKNQLNLIVRRRNQIAHEADIDFVTNTKNAISLTDVIDTKEYLCEMANRVDAQP